jgi:hypothetical protein
LRGLAINWLIVGIVASLLSFGQSLPGIVKGFRPGTPARLFHAQNEIAPSA